MKLSLASIRVNANLSQDVLAKKMNTSTSTISRWEKGFTPIPEDKFQLFCEICGVDVSQCDITAQIKGKGDNNGKDSKRKQL